jgi:hypothetical protein
MHLLLPFMVLPLCALAAWVLMTAGHQAYRVSEQVRLDALALSLCHTRKNFIDTHVVRQNRKLAQIEATMDALAIPCVASAIAGPLAELACDGARKELQHLSHAANSLQLKQDSARATYSAREAKALARITERNALDQKHGRLKFVTKTWALEDGFAREELNSLHSSLQNYFGISWPRRLVPDASFASLHQWDFEFFPNRWTVGASLRSDASPLVTELRHQVESKMSRSTSSCQVVATHFTTFRVRRR